MLAKNEKKMYINIMVYTFNFLDRRILKTQESLNLQVLLWYKK